MPAGTGVWVVNTPPPRTASIASAKVRPRVGPFADPLEAEKAGVALVGVEDLRMDVEGAQRPDAADAEDDLLAEAVLLVAAVEAVRDRNDLRRVLRHVRVEEIERDAAHVDAPHVDLGGDARRVRLRP